MWRLTFPWRDAMCRYLDDSLRWADSVRRSRATIAVKSEEYGHAPRDCTTCLKLYEMREHFVFKTTTIESLVNLQPIRNELAELETRTNAWRLSRGVLPHPAHLAALLKRRHLRYQEMICARLSPSAHEVAIGLVATSFSIDSSEDGRN